MNQQLQALEEICYTKLAQFIQEERLDEAEKLFCIVKQLPPSQLLIGQLPLTYVKPKLGHVVAEPKNYTTIPTQSSQSTYEWADGYVDPRERDDYWKQ